jgi:hypothetical protein
LNEQVNKLKQHINDFVDDIKDKFEDIETEIKAKVAKEAEAGDNAKQAK